MMAHYSKHRAAPSGIKLTECDAALVKAMLLRGDRQHDVAAWFGVNGGRIGEIAKGQAFSWVEPAAPEGLPPQGPYPCGREAVVAAKALAAAKNALAEAERLIKIHYGEAA